jgi:elongation factor 2
MTDLWGGGEISVGFGSRQHGWAFTLKLFTEMYADKLKIDTIKSMNR